MPNFTFASVAVNRATCAVDFGGGNVLHVDYYPAKLTTKFLLEMAAVESAEGSTMQDKLTEQVNALLALIASWDAFETDEAGNETTPLPLDFDTLSALPVSTLGMIFKAIAQDQAGEASAPTA